MNSSYSFGFVIFIAILFASSKATKTKIVKNALCFGWCKINGVSGYAGGQWCHCKPFNPMNPERKRQKYSQGSRRATSRKDSSGYLRRNTRRRKFEDN